MNQSNSLKPQKLNRTTIASFLILALGYTWIAWVQPITAFLVGILGLIYMTGYYLMKAVPVIQRWIPFQIKIYHIILVKTTLVLFLSTTQPANALFLSGLQDYFRSIVESTETIGGNPLLTANQIDLIFNIIRAILLLLVAATTAFAYNQAQQQNDWRPIINQIGIAFGFVIGVDIITYIFTGGGGGSSS